MEANKILQADLLDIIFEGKNKMYGAYDMRKTYSRKLKKAITITFSFIAVIIAGSVMANKVKPSDRGILEVKEVEMSKIAKEKPLPVIPPPVIPPPVTKAAPEVNQVRFLPPVVIEDKLVAPDEKIESIAETQMISDKTIKTDNLTKIIHAPTKDIGTDVAAIGKVPDDAEKIFINVEIDAKFPGGTPAWRKYLLNKFNPETPIDNGAPEGTYTVIVRFIVSKDGSTSDVVAETNPGYGMEQEAIKVIKNVPK